MIADRAARRARLARRSGRSGTSEVMVLGGSVAYLAAIPAVLVVLALRLGTWRTVVALIAVAHVAILASVALFPLPIDPVLLANGHVYAANTAGEALNLVPFRTIGSQLSAGASAAGRTEALLNLFVLAPAGIYLPVLIPRLRSWRFFVPAAIVIGGSIEAAQLAISLVIGFRYRTIDVDDWILNTVGLLIGFAVWQLLAMVAARRGGQAANRSPSGAIGG
jgi:glycopeptide antibiotics resistance protein